jgi:hypothetical protein
VSTARVTRVGGAVLREVAEEMGGVSQKDGGSRGPQTQAARSRGVMTPVLSHEPRPGGALPRARPPAPSRPGLESWWRSWAVRQSISRMPSVLRTPGAACSPNKCHHDGGTVDSVPKQGPIPLLRLGRGPRGCVAELEVVVEEQVERPRQPGLRRPRKSRQPQSWS